MFKFLVLGLLVCQQVVVGICGQTRADAVDTEVPSLFAITGPPNNGLGLIMAPEPVAKYSFHATNQFFFMQSPIGVQNSTDSSGNSPGIGHKLPAGYVGSNGIGAHKVHNRRLTWNKARQACVDEGAHLAVIRSSSEDEIILRLMEAGAVGDAWVGYHDLFEEGSFITVLDEPLERTGWARWWRTVFPNPDNLGGQNCVVFRADHSGIDDISCSSTAPFICKIEIVQEQEKTKNLN